MNFSTLMNQDDLDIKNHNFSQKEIEAAEQLLLFKMAFSSRSEDTFDHSQESDEAFVCRSDEEVLSESIDFSSNKRKRGKISPFPPNYKKKQFQCNS